MVDEPNGRRNSKHRTRTLQFHRRGAETAEPLHTSCQQVRCSAAATLRPSAKRRLNSSITRPVRSMTTLVPIASNAATVSSSTVTNPTAPIPRQTTSGAPL